MLKAQPSHKLFCIGGDKMNRLVLIGVLFVGGLSADTMLVDQSPSTGTPVCCWQNQTAQQNFADVFTITAPTYLTAYNQFTGDGFPNPAAGAFDFRIFANSGGIPGALITSWDQAYDPFTVLGGGIAEESFTLAPVLLGPGTYWIGVSGNGFEAGQLSMLGDAGGDNQMAQFNGTSFQFMTGVGDQSFQLFVPRRNPPVPEPTSVERCSPP